ncbi:MAG: hypothetical protein LBI19_09565 [Oscillospiraceae bacterium]|jgi:hypothetical protein|nr:hypothetical protein [Oscillospiraceae bacterium]
MSEKEKILELLENGKITAEEAAGLFGALGLNTVTSNNNNNARRPENPALKGKKLRVKVEGAMSADDEDDDVDIERINVNVALPLSLAKIADGILSNVIPKEVSKELEAEGINLKGLNLGEIVDALTDTDEDIVNVDMMMNGKPMLVRVYVE